MTRDQFVAALRTALMQLDDFNSLRHSPLLPLLCAENEPNPVAFQQRLVAAIQQVRQSPGASSRHYYDVLRYRYVEHLSQSELAFQLGISERQLRRDQANAIELLGEMLWQESGAAQREPTAAERVEVSTQGESGGVGNIHAELSWLKRQFPAEAGRVDKELQKAIAGASALASALGVEMRVDVPERMAAVPVPPLALRQALLTMLTTLIPACNDSWLSIRGGEESAAVVILMQCQVNVPVGSEEGEWTTHLRIAQELIQPFGAEMQIEQAHLLTLQLRFPTLHSVPVLMVDDNPDTAHLFQRYAANSRFHLIPVQDGRAVVELALRHKVAAVLLDIMMAGMDGWDVLAQLRHHPETQDLPVAICTILPQRDLSRVLGADLFLQKPVSQEEFLQALVELTASRGPKHG